MDEGGQVGNSLGWQAVWVSVELLGDGWEGYLGEDNNVAMS